MTLVLIYHGVKPTGDLYSAAVDDLDWQLGFLRRHGRIVPLSDIRRHAMKEIRLPRFSFAVTFDDVPESVFIHARGVLKKHDARASFFVLTGSAGRTFRTSVSEETLAGWDMIETLNKEGFEIGAHGQTHRIMTELNEEEREAEISGSHSALLERLGKAPEHFAYPKGRFDADILNRVRRAGFQGGVTTERRSVRPGADPFALPRAWVPTVHPRFRFAYLLFRMLLQSPAQW